MNAVRRERSSPRVDRFDERAAASAPGRREFNHFRINAAGVVLDYHSSPGRLPARSAADVVGAHVSMFLPEEFATPLLRGVDECLSSQSVVDVDYTLQLDDGAVRYRQARLAPNGDDEVVGIVCDNTANRVTEARLKHLAEILDASSDFIATTDTAGQILYANGAFRERFGVGSIDKSGAELPSLFDFFTAESRDQFLRDGVPELWKSGRWSGEVEGLDANGGTVPISQSAIAHRSRDGRARYFSGIARDITETKAAQAAVFESHQRFQALVALGHDAIFVVTARGRITYASPATQRIVGYTPEELMGTISTDLIHPDDVEDAVASFATAFGDAPAGLQTRVRHRDGTWRWIESYTTNHLETPGVNGYIINARDITARKRANEQIEQASELLASVMGAAANEAIFVTDASGTIVAFSRGAEVLLGYNAADVIGVRYPRAFHLQEQIAQTAATLGITADDLFVYSPPGGQPIVRDWVFVRRDGTRFPGSLTVCSRFDSHGKLCGFLYVARDISEQRRVEAELIERANHDTLTGLGNRAHLQTILQTALANSAPSGSGRTLMFIDLDRFKIVNDSYGHATGDTVLRGTAQRLNECLRADDVAIRLGGDEFVVVLRPNVSEQDARRIAERIIEAVSRPFPIGDNLICIGASIGLATSTTHTTTDELLLRADQAAYAAKHAGRGRVVVAPNDWPSAATSARIM